MSEFQDVQVSDKLECGSEQGLLTFEFPKHLQHPSGRTSLTAAYLLEYWATKGAIPCYQGVIDELRKEAEEIFRVAKPVRSSTGDRGPKACAEAKP